MNPLFQWPAGRGTLKGGGDRTVMIKSATPQIMARRVGCLVESQILEGGGWECVVRERCREVRVHAEDLGRKRTLIFGSDLIPAAAQ